MPATPIAFDDGRDIARAVAAARDADIAIVFALKPGSEAVDTNDLALPAGQDALIGAVAAANPRTIVVLETGNPVAMPWLRSVNAVLEAWYPGQQGGEAIAALLTGKVAPSGRLPLTFPASVEQLARPGIDSFDPKAWWMTPQPKPFAVNYQEGSDIGYRWFERTHATPLFPFGFGLTYTRFVRSALEIRAGRQLSASFTVRNIGARAGVDIPQLYVGPPGRTHRLAGWARLSLQPGEARRVTIVADPRIVASYKADGWHRSAGDYDLWVSSSAALSGLHATARLGAQAVDR